MHAVDRLWHGCYQSIMYRILISPPLASVSYGSCDVPSRIETHDHGSVVALYQQCQSQFDQLEYVFLCWYPQKLQLTKNRLMTLRPCKPVTYRTSQRTIPCVIVTIRSCFISSNSYSERIPPSDLYHAMTWPSLSYVAEDAKGRVVGYVLAKMCVILY